MASPRPVFLCRSSSTPANRRQLKVLGSAGLTRVENRQAVKSWTQYPSLPLHSIISFSTTYARATIRLSLSCQPLLHILEATAKK